MVNASAPTKARKASPAVAKATAAVPSAAKKRRRRIIMIVTDKGGKGKSTLVTQLGDWLSRRHPTLKWAGVDPDISAKTFAKLFPGRVLSIDPRKQRLDAIYDLLAANDVVIVDGMGSQTEASFLPWLQATNIWDLLPEFDLDVTFVAIVEQSLEVLQQTASVFKALGNKGASFLFARSLVRSAEMPGWDGSMTRQLAIEGGHAAEMRIPKIHAHLMLEMEVEERRAPLQKASEDLRFGLGDRQRLRNRARLFYREFRQVRHVLLPAAYAEEFPEFDGGLDFAGVQDEEAFWTGFENPLEEVA